MMVKMVETPSSRPDPLPVPSYGKGVTIFLADTADKKTTTSEVCCICYTLYEFLFPLLFSSFLYLLLNIECETQAPINQVISLTLHQSNSFTIAD